MKVPKELLIVVAAILVSAIASVVVVSFVNKEVSTDTKKDAERYDGILRHIGDTNCPKCNGRMENGFIVDRGSSRMFVNTWVQGTPQAGGSGVNSEPGSVVVTMRCKACGFLESYAK